MLVALARLSSATASLANASCSWPSTATWPVSGASMPIEVEHLLPLLATAVELLEPLAPLLLLLLLLLLLPQPAATSAVSASAANVMRPFIGLYLLLGVTDFTWFISAVPAPHRGTPVCRRASTRRPAIRPGGTRPARASSPHRSSRGSGRAAPEGQCRCPDRPDGALLRRGSSPRPPARR